MSAAIGYYYAIQIQDNGRPTDPRHPRKSQRRQPSPGKAPRQGLFAKVFGFKPARAATARHAALHS